MLTFFQELVIRTLGNYTGKIKVLTSHKSKPKYSENSKTNKKKGWGGGQGNTETTSEVTVSVKCMIMQCGSLI